MKYLLSGAALLVLVAAGPAWANNVFDCQDVGMSAPEPLGDQEGHALLTGTFSCRLTAGPMAGGLLTGTLAWEMNKGEGTLISGTGVIRKPGSLVVYKDTEGTLKLTMDDKGQVTGFTGSGAARILGVPFYKDVPPLQGTYFGYWHNVAVSGLELYVRERRGVYAWATNDELTLVGVNWAAPDFGAIRSDIQSHYLDVIASSAPSLRARLQQATRQGRFIGGAIANFMRKPFGPGWALVGDAGLTVDPCTSAGINNAFRDVETLVEAVDDGLSGRKPMPVALANYHSQRDERSGPIYQFACQLAPFAPPPPEMIQLFAALASNPADTNRFLGLFAQTVSPVEFFAPSNLQQNHWCGSSGVKKPDPFAHCFIKDFASMRS